MATATITHVQRIDGYAVVRTLTPTDIDVGRQVTVAGLTESTLDGTHTVVALPVNLFTGVADGELLFDTDVLIAGQVMFADAGDDIAMAADAGTLTYATDTVCTWITADDVLDYLGIAVASAEDTAYLAFVVPAANAFAFRRRAAAGYFDTPATSPGGDVTLGTILYAGALYRARGSLDTFASFEGGPVPTPASGQVLQLLGVNRPRVA